MPILARYNSQQVERARWLQCEIQGARLDLFSNDPVLVSEAREWIQTCAGQLATIHAAAALAASSD